MIFLGMPGPENTNGGADADNSNASKSKRQRAKQACEPCRLRKRRCDGAMPCNMCKQFEYKCYFEKHSRKRSKLVEQNAHNELSDDYVRPAEPLTEERATAEDTYKTRNMEANSGMAFTRLLGKRLDPTFGPKFVTFGWNLGIAGAYNPLTVTPLSDLMNQDQMYALAQLYFQEVHALYGFLDKDYMLQQISLRWAQPEMCAVPDHLLANLAAVGSAFSDGSFSSFIPSVVETAKRDLDATSMMQPPTIFDVQSWMMRCLYLRLADHAHAAHTASCVCMHLIEGLGLHEEVNNAVLHPPGMESMHSPDIRRRIFWLARMFNTWVSYEYGRTRVTLRGITARLPNPRDGDLTVDYLNLYSLSCFLDPERPDLRSEDFLQQLDEFEAKHECIELSKANLGLCTYRRIRLSNPNPSPEIVNIVIKLSLGGVEAARRTCEKGWPWWHMANIPFQTICVFLAMDVRESLSHIASVLRVLEQVAERFPTAVMKEAVKTARFLIRLSKRRKDEDSNVLADSLKRETSPSATAGAEAIVANTSPPVLQQTLMAQPQFANGNVPVQQINTPMTASSEDWAMNLINNTEFDWNVFLTQDIPAFNSFAPDGTM